LARLTTAALERLCRWTQGQYSSVKQGSLASLDWMSLLTRGPSDGDAFREIEAPGRSSDFEAYPLRPQVRQGLRSHNLVCRGGGYGLPCNDEREPSVCARNVKNTPTIKFAVGATAFDGNARFVDDPGERGRIVRMLCSKYRMFLPVWILGQALIRLNVMKDNMNNRGAFQVTPADA